LFTTSEGTDSLLRATDLEGHARIVFTSLTRATIFDIAADGRVLLGSEMPVRHVEAITPDHPSELRDYSLTRDQSVGRSISADGRTIAVTDQTTRGYVTYVRKSDGAAPVRVGTGDALDFSPDERFVVSIPSAPPMHLVLHPTGAGTSRDLPNPDAITVENARWTPDGRKVVFFGPTPKSRSRGYLQDIDGGNPVAFTPEGVETPAWWALAVSPDGARVTARGPDGVIALWPLNGGAAQPLPSFPADAAPLEFSSDGRRLVIATSVSNGWVLSWYDVTTGAMEKIRDVTARDAAGLRATFVSSTPDAKYFVHSYSQLLVDLFVVEGLR
jgi:Tol biopolymer transport system component